MIQSPMQLVGVLLLPRPLRRRPVEDRVRHPLLRHHSHPVPIPSTIGVRAYTTHVHALYTRHDLYTRHWVFQRHSAATKLFCP